MAKLKTVGVREFRDQATTYLSDSDLGTFFETDMPALLALKRLVLSSCLD
jgi:hypothetical protein